MEFTPQILDGGEPFDCWPGGPVPPCPIGFSEALPRDNGCDPSIRHDATAVAQAVQRLARLGAIHIRQFTSELHGRLVIACRMLGVAQGSMMSTLLVRWSAYPAPGLT